MCRRCRQSGLVDVVSTDTLERFARFPQRPLLIRFAVARCTCPRGLRRSPRIPELQAWHVPRGRSEAITLERMRDWLRARDEARTGMLFDLPELPADRKSQAVAD